MTKAIRRALSLLACLALLLAVALPALAEEAQTCPSCNQPLPADDTDLHFCPWCGSSLSPWLSLKGEANIEGIECRYFGLGFDDPNEHLVRLGASVPSRQYIPAGANKFLVSVFRSSVDGKHTMRIYKPDGSVYEESIDFMANTTITCSDFYCQTLSDFPQGHYVLALDDHVLDELDIVISDTDNEGAEYPTPRSDVHVLQAGVGWSNGDTTVYAHSGTVLGADELNCLKYSIGFTLTNYSGDSVFVKPTLVNLTRGETILDISDPTEIPHRGISNFWLTTDFPDLAGDYEIQLDGQPVYRFTVTEPES